MSTANSELHKTCQGCIWADSCKSDERCWGYDDGNIYPIEKGEYEKALRERVEAYDEIVREFD